MCHAQNHRTYTAGLVGDIGRAARCDLNGVEVAAIREPVDLGAESLVDLVEDECFLELSGAVGGQSVEAG